MTDYIVINLADTVEITTGEKPTIVEKKMACGEIQTNLWDAMVENHINPMMSIELSEIYAWSIDFFGLKKGDNFYVIYEERFLDTVSVGIEHIEAALFNHQDKDFYAIYFVQNERGSYFDEKGGSLRRAFLKAPLKFRRISSRYTNRRYHPVLKIYRPHHGVDYAAAEGTPVHSVGDGVVLKKGYQKNGAGNYIKIKHNSVYMTQYAHLSRFAKGLKTGDHVKQGQLIGYVGHTGLATGPHLDFRFFKNGHPVDPLKVDAPPVEPIKKINKKEFDKIKKYFMKQLNAQRDSCLQRDSIRV
jgi:murein DD-endopeptidase MepM/ murein hydrolase activator NlpD